MTISSADLLPLNAWRLLTLIIFGLGGLISLAGPASTFVGAEVGCSGGTGGAPASGGFGVGAGFCSSVSTPTQK